MFYYYHVCERKLWYFSHDITMEQTNENVAIGKIIDAESYAREDKHINIDSVINIDFIKTKGVLHEVKKSRKIENASIFQVKYYLYYLQKHGVMTTAILDYPLLKQRITVKLEEGDTEKIEKALDGIKHVLTTEKPPDLKKKAICKSCAFHDLCLI